MRCATKRPSEARSGSRIAKWYRPSNPRRGTGLALLSALAGATEHIGLIATGSTTFDEPYHVARRFASLDHISGGRAGWNIVTTSNPDAALNFGLDEHMEHGERYRRARPEVLDPDRRAVIPHAGVTARDPGVVELEHRVVQTDLLARQVDDQPLVGHGLHADAGRPTCQ